MTKKHRKRRISKSQAEYMAATITNRTGQGIQAVVVAGAEILQAQYGFTEEQRVAWATETVQLAGKYLKINQDGV